MKSSLPGGPRARKSFTKLVQKISNDSEKNKDKTGNIMITSFQWHKIMRGYDLPQANIYASGIFFLNFYLFMNIIYNLWY